MEIRKIFLSVLIGVVVLSLSGIFSANASNNKGQIEKIVFIHYKKNPVKPSGGSSKKAPTCYTFLSTRKVKWPTAVNYVINPTNSQGLDLTFVQNAISASAETWDNVTTREIANVPIIDADAAYNNSMDGKNLISFGNNFSDSNIIAAAAVWYNTRTGVIVEFDISFETEYQWGDAIVDSSKMDLQNIATHEIGHAFGLGDVYKSECSAVTMYGYSDEGDIAKRSLEQPDITGIQVLYGGL